MNKKFVIECSSIYDIDFAAVVFSIINNDECEYEIYLNEAADTKTEFRRFVSRLAIPTLSWENDPHDVLRQKHLALDSLEVEEFLELLNNAIHSYIQLLKGKYDRYHKQLLERLKSELLADQLNNVIDCYKRLIELIIELITGKRIRVSLFGDIRTGERTDICKKSVYNIYKEIEKLNPGRYKFVKGGRIEIELDGEWIGIKRFYKEDKRIIFTDDEGHLYSFEDIVSSRAIRFRGPIETALIFSIGTLIDLPWYMGAVMSYEPVDMSGIEYISPISISSTMRVSKMAGGNGMRLCPSGYSLIDYEADNVLLLLMNIYPEDKIIDHEDLNSWKIIVNNYPVSNQKLSKSQSSIPALCNIIKKQGILDENGIKCNRTEYKNYIRMGDAILEIYNTFRFLRQYINNKSPFYHNENLRGVFYFANNFTNIIEASGMMVGTLPDL